MGDIECYVLKQERNKTGSYTVFVLKQERNIAGLLYNVVY